MGSPVTCMQAVRNVKVYRVRRPGKHPYMHDQRHIGQQIGKPIKAIHALKCAIDCRGLHEPMKHPLASVLVPVGSLNPVWRMQEAQL